MHFSIAQRAGIFLVLINFSISLFAQKDTAKTKPGGEDYDQLYCTVIEEPARFPGGTTAWLRYLSNSTIYPEIAVNNRSDGIICIQFVVARDGSITAVTALNALKDSLTEMAIRVIKASPKWIPATRNGRPVSWRTIQQITFELQPMEEETPCEKPLPGSIPVS